MDAKTLDFATAQVILASMRQDQELIIYEKPLEEILKICDEIKNTIRGFERGVPEDLPVKVSQDVGSAVFLRTATKKWEFQEEKKLTDNERTYLIKNIMKKYKEVRLVKEYVNSELLDPRQAPDDFLIALNKMTSKEVTRKLSDWSGYELEDVFKKVEQKIDVSRKILEPSDSFKRRFHLQAEKSPKLSKYRDRQAAQIFNMFKKEKRAPIGYLGDGLPNYEYVRNKLLPHIVWYANKKQLAKKAVDEGFMYGAWRGMFLRE